jgi:hypothetical protein
LIIFVLLLTPSVRPLWWVSVTAAVAASINGKSAEASKHLCTVTGLSANQVNQHIDAAFALWRRRSVITWELDLGILLNADITLAAPPSATERADLPGKILRRI